MERWELTFCKWAGGEGEMEQLGKRGEYHDDMLLQNSEEERISNARLCLQLLNFCNTRIEKCPTNLAVHSLSITGKPLSWHCDGREGYITIV